MIMLVNMNNSEKIVLYKKPDWSSEISVKLDWDTIWLNQSQIADLFDVSVKTINEHLLNIYKSWELKENWTIRKNQIVQAEWKRQVKRTVNFYNLDAIISVWYRVSSKNATTFRIWATTVLKQYLITWYALNQKRIQEIWLKNFEKAVNLIKKNIETNTLRNKEIKWMLSVITEYAHSWIILQKYDEWSLNTINLSVKKAESLTYDEAMDAISSMKREFLPKKEVSEAFWEERNDWLRWILDQVYQTFDWSDLYPSIQEKAAALMYFTIKDHPFVDWNKKIWAFLLLVFLGKNKCLEKEDWSKIIDDDTLIALTLLVATSDPSERNMIMALIIQFIS